MLSETKASKLLRYIIPLCIALISFFYLASALPKTTFVQESTEYIEDSKMTVMDFATATLAASVAITVLPDDFASPIANSLADMEKYFVLILIALFLEKLIAVVGVKLAFKIIIPIACGLYILGTATKKNKLKELSKKVTILAIVVALLVPCSTLASKTICADYLTYVDETIANTENGSQQITEISQGTNTDEKSMFAKITDAIGTAIKSTENLVTYFKENVKRCINSIAILIVADCVIPLLTMLLLIWIIKQLFHIQEIKVPDLVIENGNNEKSQVKESK